MNDRHLTPAEAVTYIHQNGNDELSAAEELAMDRALEAGETEEPDYVEIHHALFLITRALHRKCPSWDDTLLELKLRAGPKARSYSAVHDGSKADT
jgi:hypothetical protein